MTTKRNGKGEQQHTCPDGKGFIKAMAGAAQESLFGFCFDSSVMS
jgi:hypothetical protein